MGGEKEWMVGGGGEFGWWEAEGEFGWWEEIGGGSLGGEEIGWVRWRRRRRRRGLCGFGEEIGGFGKEEVGLREFGERVSWVGEEGEENT